MTTLSGVSDIASKANQRLEIALNEKVKADRELERAFDEQQVAMRALSAITHAEDYYVDQGRRLAMRMPDTQPPAPAEATYCGKGPCCLEGEHKGPCKQ